MKTSRCLKTLTVLLCALHHHRHRPGTECPTHQYGSMNSRKPILVSVALLVAVVQLLAAGEEGKQGPKSRRLAEWKDVTIELFSTCTNRIAQVRGKKSCYSGFSAFYNGDVPIPHSGMAVTITVTAFVTDSGKTWAGPGRDFYIETDSGIIGGENWSPLINWCHSLVSNRPGERLDLATVIRRFDQQAHEISLYDASALTQIK